jgi:uncharacterized protein
LCVGAIAFFLIKKITLGTTAITQLCIPIDGKNLNDGYLWNNHEYVSYPISTVAPGTPSSLAEFPETYSLVIGQDLPQDKTDILVLGEFMYNLGGSVVRISRSGHLVVK